MAYVEAILGFLASNMIEITGLFATILTIIVVFTQRQLRVNRAKPVYHIGTGPSEVATTLANAGQDTDRKSVRKLEGKHLFYPVFLDEDEQSKFDAKEHIFYFPISIRNTGNHPIENLQVLLEYPSKHLVHESEFKNLFPDGVATKQHENGVVETFEMIENGDGEGRKNRKVTTALGFAQVIIDIPSVRPGESFVYMDMMRFPHTGSAPFSEMMIKHSGYDAISKRLNSVKGIKNNFPVTAHFHANNHRPYIRRAIVFSLHGTADNSQNILNQYALAHWLGAQPPRGRYFSPPLGFAWIMRRFGWIGGLSRSMKQEQPLFLHSTIPFYNKRKDGTTVSIDETKPSIIGFGSVFLPNIDFFKIPNWVQDTKSLTEWVGFSPAPKFLGGPDFNSIDVAIEDEK